MLDAIAEFAAKDNPTSLQRVRIVIYNAPHQLTHFQEALLKKVDDMKSGSGHNWIWKVLCAYSEYVHSLPGQHAHAGVRRVPHSNHLYSTLLHL